MGPTSKGRKREGGQWSEDREGAFSLYLSIHGFRKGPGKFLMGVLQRPREVLNFLPVKTREPCVMILTVCCVMRRLLQKSGRMSMIRNAIWCLSNLCRGKNPPPDFSKVILLFPLLPRFLISVTKMFVCSGLKSTPYWVDFRGFRRAS